MQFENRFIKAWGKTGKHLVLKMKPNWYQEYSQELVKICFTP